MNARTPDWSRELVEAELTRRLGAAPMSWHQSPAGAWLVAHRGTRETIIELDSERLDAHDTPENRDEMRAYLAERLEASTFQESVKIHHSVPPEESEFSHTSEEQLLRFVLSLHEVLLELDEDGRILFLSPSWSRLTGHALSDTQDHDIRHYLANPADAEPILEVARGAVNSISQEILIRCADESARPFELYAEAAYGPGDRTTVYGTLHDLSIQKAAQEELRVAKLHAEKANRAKSEFLANMSHEIRTPMTAILGYLDLLAESTSSRTGTPEQEEALEAIQRNGLHLLALINDILDLSKIESGSLEIESRRFDLIDLVRDTCELLEPRARSQELGFRLEFVAPLPRFVESDPTRLKQIIVNLLGNSLKFTRRGVVEVRISAEEDGDTAAIHFDVSDTGIGMSLDEQERVFQPFSQADGSITRRFGGTGLGLAISRSLARSLGGDLTVVATERDIGTRFRLTIRPHAIERLETDLDDRRRRRRRPSSSRIPLSCRVLVVEDGVDNQRLLRRILERSGARVDVRNHGAEGVEAVTKAAEAGTPYDLILMDMQMPVMDGYRATDCIKSLGVTTPIIALTAHAMQGDRDRCLEAGCDDYLSKPIDRTRLLETVRRWTERDLVQ